MKNFTTHALTKWLLKKLLIPLCLLAGGYDALAQMPDLIILDVYWENLNGPDDHIERGDSVIFYFWGKNIGNDSTPAGVTLGGQFRVSELDHGWVLYQQAGWAVVKDSFLLAGDSIHFQQEISSGSNGTWIAGPPGNYKVWTWFDDAGASECKRICEEDETNNFSTEFFTVYPSESMPGKMPDLVVTDLQFVDNNGDTINPTDNDDVLFQAVVKNIGSDTAIANDNKIVVSFYNLAVSDDNLVASTSMEELFDILAPGEIVMVTGNLSRGNNNGTAPGSWLAHTGDTLIICVVDADSLVTESTETNNTYSKMLYVDVAEENQKPDLQITDIIFDPMVPVDGDTVTLSVMVKNAGTVGIASGSGINAVWTDPEGDPISVAAGGNVINDSIPPDQTVIITGNFESHAGRWLPPGPGSFKIGAIVDQGGVVEEASENNNEFNKVLVVNPLADLAVTEVSWVGAPDSLEALKDVVFTATVENMFGVAANAGEEFIMTWNVTGFGDIGHDTIVLADPLEVGESVSFTMQETWLAFSGNRQVTANLATMVNEKYTDNNSASDSIFIKKYGGLLPDLVPIEIKYTPENPRQGDTIQLSVVVKNTGDTATMAGFGVIAHFHINGTQVGWVHDTSIYMPSIAVDEEIELPFDRIFAGRYFTYPRYGEGDHTVRATIDRDLKIEEKDDDNNVLEIIVTIGPPRRIDLTVSDLSWSPVEPVVDDMITLSAYIKNKGELDLADTIYVIWSMDDITIDSLQFADGLKVGDSVMVSGINAWQAELGTHSITVMVNAHWMVEESDSANNITGAEITVIETYIDEMRREKVEIYPNPAVNYLRVNYISSEYQTTQMRITNILGEILLDKTVDLIPGSNNFELIIEKLPAGIYFMKISFETLKFIIK
jgi:subtilase family serine protease